MLGYEELDGEVAAGRLARYHDVAGAADLLGQGAVGGRDVLERGGVGVLGREPVVDRHGAHARLAGQAGRQPRRSRRGPEGEAAAVNVEDGAARLDVGDVDEDHGDAAQVSGRRVDVCWQGMRGEHLLEEGALGGDVPAEIERGVAEDLVDHVALLGGHLPFLSSWRAGAGAPGSRAWSQDLD